MFAFACPLMIELLGKKTDGLLGNFGVFVQGLDDHLDSHGRYTDMPYIVVGYMCHGCVANFSLSGEKCLGRCGHSNDGHSPGPIQFGFGLRGKAGTLNGDKPSTSVNHASCSTDSSFELIRKVPAERVCHTEMRHQAFLKK